MRHTEIHSLQTTSQPSGRKDRLSVDPGALFVYGSLLFPEVLQALLHRVPDQSPATAVGWRVVALPGRVYPTLVPGEGSASGLLMVDLHGEEWRVLDAFEDEVYELRCLALLDGRRGWAYVCDDGSHTLSEDWDVDRFATRDLAAYVNTCVAWRRRYDATT
jgi:gamma-glutamylcyclotransferase (GGCT)/AIG2-like uncharacterized protein YtfP